MNVVTLKKHRHRNEVKEVGDKYEINSKSVERLYRALGWVTEVPPELKPIVHNNFVSNPLPTTPKPVLTKATAKGSPKGKYQRKDLRAEK